MPVDIKSRSLEELQAQFQAWGEPAYRLKQVLQWLYGQRVTGWEEMTNLPNALRDKLKEQYSLTTLELVRKHLHGADGQRP